jgi:F-type H+-transporting ATPase subunit b
MISINATLILQVVQFLILVFILNRLVLQPILKLINERGEHVQNTKREIDSIGVEINRFKDEYVTTERNARGEAAQERSHLRSTGIVRAEELEVEARKEVASIRAGIDEEAEREVRKTQPSLRGEAEVLADRIIERVIGRRIVPS